MVSTLITLVISLALLALAFYVVAWLIDWAKIPEPMQTPIRVITAIIFILLFLGMMFGVVPHPVQWRQ